MLFRNLDNEPTPKLVKIRFRPGFLAKNNFYFILFYYYYFFIRTKNKIENNSYRELSTN
jgi:hypothetical protein